jgi:DNA-binding Lrp family transcriptional regulator
MPTAYVLLNCELGSEEDVIKEVRKIQGVVEVNGIYGVYDIVVKVESDSMDRLREAVTWKIRKIDNVKTTLTLIKIEGQGEGKKK